MGISYESSHLILLTKRQNQCISGVRVCRVIWFHCKTWAAESHLHSSLKTEPRAVLHKFSTQQQDDVSGKGKWPIRGKKESDSAVILLSLFPSKGSSAAECIGSLHFLCTCSRDRMSPATKNVQRDEHTFDIICIETNRCVGDMCRVNLLGKLRFAEPWDQDDKQG